MKKSLEQELTEILNLLNRKMGTGDLLESVKNIQWIFRKWQHQNKQIKRLNFINKRLKDKIDDLNQKWSELVKKNWKSLAIKNKEIEQLNTVIEVLKEKYRLAFDCVENEKKNLRGVSPLCSACQNRYKQALKEALYYVDAAVDSDKTKSMGQSLEALYKAIEIIKLTLGQEAQCQLKKI